MPFGNGVENTLSRTEGKQCGLPGLEALYLSALAPAEWRAANRGYRSKRLLRRKAMQEENGEGGFYFLEDIVTRK